jgi:HK97 family phage portal protein
MAIVRTLSGLQAMTRRGFTTPTLAASSLSTYGYSSAYATIYATQPNVRVCVDFLARNIAQIGYHIFRRVSDTDRVRLVDHELAQWLEKPNPATTRYRLFESFIADLAVYFNAFWLKVRITDPARRIGLVRMPPETVEVQGGLLPSGVIWTYDGQAVPLDMTELVYANGYNPLNPLVGLSPLETLRRILAEDLASSDHRTRYWANASRMEGVVERPKDAPKWTPQQKQSWREQWQARYTGPQSTGQTPVLEDGMTFRQISYSARDSEYVAARQLTREECARAYHIPLPMVGILDHATFSNIREQHKQLYADCLGPWLEMVSEAIELWLLPEARDTENVYGEFNIAEKLKGSFEEQATALRLLVGRPVMTANEGRARLNLPSMKDDPSADQLAAQQGGPAAASDAAIAPASAPDGAVAGLPDARQSATALAFERAAPIIQRHQQRQRSYLQRLPAAARAAAFRLGCPDRWTPELARDLRELFDATEADAIARLTNDDTVGQLERDSDAA